jgi:thiol-disulfide isomerase/thioredoxin
MPEIETWQSEFDNKINFVFISNGTAEENIEKFAGKNLQTILLQKNKQISELFSAPWTPTAIYINDDGNIASRPAAGDEAIRELVEKIKSAEEDEKFFYIPNENSFGRPPKIGVQIPEFSLKDLNDNEFTDEDFRGKQTLVMFFGLTCPHCTAMHDDLHEWENTKNEDEPNLVIFSEGDAETHREFNFRAPILLEKDYKTAMKFGMHGTPSAVLVDENGVIISETAIGAPQIWSLIGKKKSL